MIEFHVDWVLVLGPIIGIVLPLLVGIVTKASTNPGTKAVLLAALALVTNLVVGIFNALQDNTSYNLGAALILALGTFIVSVATHYGFWQPTGVTSDLQHKVGVKDNAPTV